MFNRCLAKERKRQYSALRRAIHKEAPPALVAKFSLCNDKERFNMLKQWVANGEDLLAIDIEDKYKSWVSELRTDRYVTARASIHFNCVHVKYLVKGCMRLML